MNVIPSYNPEQHQIPIKWFNTNKIRHIQFGKNEEVIKNCTTLNYPANSILIKFHNKNMVEVNFMGKPIDPNSKEWWQRQSRRANVLLSKNITRVTDNKGGFSSFLYSKEFNGLLFKTTVSINKHEDSLTLNEMMTYINYIIKQIG